MHEEPKLKDRLGRSWRFAPPEDDGKFFALTENDLKLIALLDDHGPLPTSYLWHEASKFKKDEQEFKKWLRRAFKRANTPDGGPYITRPPQQKAAYRADRQELTHNTTEAGKKALIRSGFRTYPKRIDHMHHRFMGSCITASLRFAAEGRGLRFLRLQDILDHPKCPPQAAQSQNPLAFQTKPGVLVPDDLNGIGIPVGDKTIYRRIAWEFDRATETLDAIEFKMQCYLDMISNKKHVDAWGISSMWVAIVTTAPARMANMMDRLVKITKKDPALREHFFFKHKRIFHEEWLVPEIMTDVLTDPWERAGLPPLLLHQI
jgi:hypothetical protein